MITKRDKILLELGFPLEKNMTINYWNRFSISNKLTENIIREFKDKIIWNNVGLFSKLSEDFIREFQDSLDWHNISTKQKLSEDFIREFQDLVTWQAISINQKLSEDFIREFKDRVFWGYISCYQVISDSFLDEFESKLYWHTLIEEGKVGLKYILKHIDKTEITDIVQIKLDRYTSDEINSIKRILNLKKIYGA